MQQYKNHRCGVGARFMGVPNFIFRASCDKHDHYYEVGGGLVEKVYADVMFWAYMLEDIKKGGFSFWLRHWYFAMTVVYFVAVSIFGVLFFKWKIL